MVDITGLAAARAHAKLRACMHCKQTGYLVGHGPAQGYAPTTSAQAIRGQRLCCGKRSRRQGCGRTTCIWLATTLPRRTLRTTTLAALLRVGLAGASRMAGWAAAGLTTRVSLRHLYRVWHSLTIAQAQLRTTLVGCCAPPPLPTEVRPLAQLQAHLQHGCRRAAQVMPSTTADLDVMAAFALQFQRAALS